MERKELLQEFERRSIAKKSVQEQPLRFAYAVDSRPHHEDVS